MLRSIILLAAFIVSSTAYAGVIGDINGDGQVGLPEAVYALQSTAGIRSPLVSNDTLKNVITVAKANGNFTDPVAAVSSITDASATNPYLVVIGPGVYTITQTLQMKEYVGIVGSGENVTKLTGAISTGSSSSSAIISGASNSSLSSLTLENTGGGAYSIALYNGTVSPTISNVTALVSGGSSNYGVYNYNSSSPTMVDVSATASGGSNNYAVYNSGSSPLMTGIIATASGGSYSYGIYNSNSSSPTMTNITATASQGTNNTFGVWNYGSSSPTMTNITATASGEGWVFGVQNENSSSPTMTNVIATASGPASYGVYNFSSSPVIRRSTMKGDIYSLRTQITAATISQSTLLGPVFGADLNKCVACDNGSGTALGANCQ